MPDKAGKKNNFTTHIYIVFFNVFVLGAVGLDISKTIAFISLLFFFCKFAVFFFVLCKRNQKMN